QRLPRFPLQRAVGGGAGDGDGGGVIPSAGPVLRQGHRDAHSREPIMDDEIDRRADDAGARRGDTLLLFPPATEARLFPYLSLPMLTAYLRRAGMSVRQRDLNIELSHALFS